MEEINIEVRGVELDFELARSMALLIAEKDDPETMLISWYDAKKNIHSPQCLRCEIKGKPGWEVYGENHGGRYRISFNEEYIFIYS